MRGRPEPTTEGTDMPHVGQLLAGMAGPQGVLLVRYMCANRRQVTRAAEHPRDCLLLSVELQQRGIYLVGLRLRLAPTDQPIDHRVGDACRRAAKLARSSSATAPSFTASIGSPSPSTACSRAASSRTHGSRLASVTLHATGVRLGKPVEAMKQV